MLHYEAPSRFGSYVFPVCSIPYPASSACFHIRHFSPMKAIMHLDCDLIFKVYVVLLCPFPLYQHCWEKKTGITSQTQLCFLNKVKLLADGTRGYRKLRYWA